ncbi:hypothetical protein LIER_14330 [Lithospermum erythrorhizon]|uniref:MULE transposase domain-containing protein n=1 Tax=Lithospermum erythrorhizon TaxID=34254 RepID=A0AAV3Q2Y9_LITER
MEKQLIVLNFFSSSVHDQLNDVDGDIDLGDDSDGLKSDNGLSDGEEDHSRLGSYPKFNSVIDSRHLVYDNKTLKSSWLEKHYEKKFRNSPNYRRSDFRKELALKVGQHVSRWQAFRTKEGALRAIYGDEDKQFTRLEGFKSGCRKFVGVDGCQLKTKRGGQLLVVVGIDPNNNIYPIVYALVEVKHKDSWEWFLKHLFKDIMNIEDSWEWFLKHLFKDIMNIEIFREDEYE